jgi:hypothetical protein
VDAADGCTGGGRATYDCWHKHNVDTLNSLCANMKMLINEKIHPGCRDYVKQDVELKFFNLQLYQGC